MMAVAAALFFVSVPAKADVCNDIARAEVAQRPNVTLLNVRSKINNNGKLVCIVTARVVPKDGSPPRVVTRRFRP